MNSNLCHFIENKCIIAKSGQLAFYNNAMSLKEYCISIRNIANTLLIISGLLKMAIVEVKTSRRTLHLPMTLCSRNLHNLQ